MCLLCDCEKLNKARYLPPITPAEKRVLEQIREEVQREEAYYRAREAEFERLVLHSLKPILPLDPLVGPSDDSIQESSVDQQDFSYLLGTQYLLENIRDDFLDRHSYPTVNYNFWRDLEFENFDL